MILFLGTNDLYFGAPSAQVIAGMQQVVAATHAAGIRIAGVTLLPAPDERHRNLDATAADPPRTGQRLDAALGRF